MEAKITEESIILSLLVIAVCVAALSFIKSILIKRVAYKNGKKKRNTFLGMVFNILQYIVIVVTIFVVLTVNGINVTGLLAGLGIFATIVGLSLQDTFKDLFAGINIYGNNFYKVGDFVRYNGEICEVKFFNARISKFASIVSNSTYTVSNSTITGIEKIKDGVVLRFIFDFDVDRKVIEKCIKKALQVVEEMPGTTNVTYFGIDNIAENGVYFSSFFQAPFTKQYPIKIAFYEKAYDEFKKAGIKPSFDQDRLVEFVDKLPKK